MLSVIFLIPDMSSAHYNEGNTKTYKYDANNKLTHIIPSSGYMTVYSYDSNGKGTL